MFIPLHAPREHVLRPNSSQIAERDWQILADFWYPIAEVSEIRDLPFKATLLDVDLALFRDADGKIAVVLDMCPHRLIRLSGGTVEDGQIVCPFHGLHFDGSGKCTLVPALGDKGRLPASYRVRNFPVKELYGLVWTCLGDATKHDLPSFPTLLDAPRDELVHISSAIWPISAPRQIENFFDLAHLPFVHATTLGGDPKAELKPGHVEQTDDAVIMTAQYYETAGKTNHLCNYRYRVVLPFALEFGMQAVDDPNFSLTSCDIPSPVSAYTSRVFQILRTQLPESEWPSLRTAFEKINGEDIGVLSQMRVLNMPLDQHHEIHLPVDNISNAYRSRLRELGLGQGE
ncbi:Rieske 2Fe-2S domain-containing protein [Paraburkholderia acidiphila]|uniref:Rieske 2Fe-2S domain-containing protein n=1 Tax=Paraburkholderia acidiphila TaxID=2571747 RepID=A0A7Z2G8C1_9BURK|nr:Rieske 2Fe-2S domain-containing protein [Paraburkholderia acidiphila]QGZ56890.1 Rieske 2Fe-2S domain-containing protein [Paraburkholderia acidiphila]